MQYVDDLIIAVDAIVACKATTKELPKTLGRLGYRGLPRKLRSVNWVNLPTFSRGRRWLLNTRDYSKDPLAHQLLGSKGVLGVSQML